jgi:hypothetical protein
VVFCRRDSRIDVSIDMCSDETISPLRYRSMEEVATKSSNVYGRTLTDMAISQDLYSGRPRKELATI